MELENGMFGAPDIATIMNSVSHKYRGIASGMRSMLQASGRVISMALFFTIVIVSLTHLFPPLLAISRADTGAPELIIPMSTIPPTGAIFAAFLGYNPFQAILVTVPAPVVAGINPVTITTPTGTTCFPTTLAQAFIPSLRISFYIGALRSIIAAILSAIGGTPSVPATYGKAG